LSNGGAGLCIWGVCLAMFIVMCLAAAKGLGFSLPYEGVEGFCGGLRRKCRSSYRVKLKWGVR